MGCILHLTQKEKPVPAEISTDFHANLSPLTVDFFYSYLKLEYFRDTFWDICCNSLHIPTAINESNALPKKERERELSCFLIKGAGLLITTRSLVASSCSSQVVCGRGFGGRGFLGCMFSKSAFHLLLSLMLPTPALTVAQRSLSELPVVSLVEPLHSILFSMCKTLLF